METVMEREAPCFEGPAYERLCRIVRERTGLDLKPYKGRFLERRLAIRIRATGHRDLASYVTRLAASDEEVGQLLCTLTIHVSSFFRNPATFESIRANVFPALFSTAGSRRVRIWSVGCARGEEPYSLAILACEHLGRGRRGWDVQIHGIDVDDRVLTDAKAAEYSAAQLGEMAPALRERWFSRVGQRWRLAPEARRLVCFHRRDILMEPPGGSYDLVLCRNLLIYLDREAQEATLGRFARALRPGGFLVLGRTEIIVGSARDAFEAVDARERVYRRVRLAGPGAVAAPGVR